MQIKNVKTPQGTDWGKVKALFSIVTDEGFEIHSCKLIDGAKGFFVTGPTKARYRDGKPVMEDGKAKYDHLLWIPDTLKDEIVDLASNEVLVPADEDVPF